MLFLIYIGLGLAFVFLATIYFVYSVFLIIKHKIASFKLQNIFTVTLCVLSVFRMIPAVLLGKSITYEILWFVGWAISTIIGVLLFKIEKAKADITDDIIDVDFTE